LGDERAERLDLVFLFLLGVGELELDAAFLRLALDRVGVGGAPGAFGSDLGKANREFVGGGGGQNAGQERRPAARNMRGVFMGSEWVRLNKDR
jgi:hypothetical protein